MKATLCKYTCTHTSLSLTHAWLHSSVHEYVRLQRRFGRGDLAARLLEATVYKFVNSLSDFLRVIRKNIHMYDTCTYLKCMYLRLRIEDNGIVTE